MYFVRSWYVVFLNYQATKVRHKDVFETLSSDTCSLTWAENLVTCMCVHIIIFCIGDQQHSSTTSQSD